MRLKFDNLEDAKAKLVNTYCLYRGRSVIVKNVGYDPERERYYMTTSTVNGGHPQTVYCDDEDFNCYDYNVGYVTFEKAAAWFCRHPMRQYHQGLKANQLRHHLARPDQYGEVQFSHGRRVAEMLENVYPRVIEAQKALEQDRDRTIAFHRNFAMSFDRVHNDYIVEHKGKLIGHTKNFVDFDLMEDFVHLKESLKEAVA